MVCLVLGICLFIMLHMFKRVAPESHKKLYIILGHKAYCGLFIFGILFGVICIVFGYRISPIVPIYNLPDWAWHFNNFLMIISVGLFSLTYSKSRLRTLIRHPMLLGVFFWSVAHLLVNGDVASVLLFCSLGIWAVVEIELINFSEPDWNIPNVGGKHQDIKFVILTVIIFVIITLAHSFLGVYPFP